MTPRADVTVCIPAWQAEGFIDRTLQCARAQDHAALRILVSIDRCDDGTEAICRRHAAEDPRVDLVVQHERLGWSRNANALLDRVDTEFFFLYFHDDIIAPTYVSRLLAALRDHPDAASAHCDLERFGDREGIDRGNDYHGNAARRLLAFMVGPVKGTPLRSLTRSSLLAGGLRFPEVGADGFWRCHPFLFRLLAAGRAVHVPEILYRRWFRADSMTRTWGVATVEPLLEGQRASARLCRAEIERAAADAGELDLLGYALYLFIMIWTRREERRLGVPTLLEPAAIDPDFGFQSTRVPPVPASTEMAAWLQGSARQLQRLAADAQAGAGACSTVT